MLGTSGEVLKWAHPYAATELYDMMILYRKFCRSVANYNLIKIPNKLKSSEWKHETSIGKLQDAP